MHKLRAARPVASLQEDSPSPEQRRQGFALRALYVLYYGSNVTWLSFFNLYLQQLGFSGALIGLVAGVRPAAMLLSQPFWGILADVCGRQREIGRAHV